MRARRTLADESPPETTSLRLVQVPSTCVAPLYILDDLLREEGFADIRYVPVAPSPSARISTMACVSRTGLLNEYAISCQPSPFEVM